MKAIAINNKYCNWALYLLIRINSIFNGKYDGEELKVAFTHAIYAFSKLQCDFKPPLTFITLMVGW